MKLRYTATTTSINITVYGDPRISANLYPKSYKAHDSHCTVLRKGKKLRRFVIKTLSINAQLLPDENNKGKNEAGLDRIRKFVKKTRKLFPDAYLVRHTIFANDIPLPPGIE